MRLARHWSSGSCSGGGLGMGLGYCSTWKTWTGTLGVLGVAHVQPVVGVGGNMDLCL